LTRKSVKIKIGEGRFLYRTVVKDSPIGPNESFDYRGKLFLKALADNFDLLLCGLNSFDTIHISKDSTGWTAEAEAEGTE